jgi:arylsulfatase A-like enzyme
MPALLLAIRSLDRNRVSCRNVAIAVMTIVIMAIATRMPLIIGRAHAAESPASTTATCDKPSTNQAAGQPIVQPAGKPPAPLSEQRVNPSIEPRMRPNIILIMTDDLGYADYGFAGHPLMRTPHLDQLARDSARWEPFYVSPVCTPTRASLMTGRYHLRTRAIDTYRGRMMMDPAEVTIAEMLQAAGYATGIFGKWHLGDSYPMRAIDQGFEMSLVHRGGGLGQPSDPPGFEGQYTNPQLMRNGEPENTQGYCTDVYFREGMNWAEHAVTAGRPFFLYLATNAPHEPLHDVPEDKLAHYQPLSFIDAAYPNQGDQPLPPQMDQDKLARVAAMVENIDDNVGRLRQWLRDRQLAENTMVIYLTDNGRATAGFNAGLRGRKSDVYEGGIRSPLWVCWPTKLPAGPREGRIAAHLDLPPTLLDAAGVAHPAEVSFDGRSLWSALQSGSADWPDRTLYFQAHRGDAPTRYHHCAVRQERWKLVNPSGFGKEPAAVTPAWELFDLANDPFEQHNVAADHPELVQVMAAGYDRWFNDVSQTRPDNYAPPRIVVGSPRETTTYLTRQEWRGANWGPLDSGAWELTVLPRRGYRAVVRFRATPASGTVRITFRDRQWEQPIGPRMKQIELPLLDLPSGDGSLQAHIRLQDQPHGVMFVELTAVADATQPPSP